MHGLISISFTAALFAAQVSGDARRIDRQRLGVPTVRAPELLIFVEAPGVVAELFLKAGETKPIARCSSDSPSPNDTRGQCRFPSSWYAGERDYVLRVTTPPRPRGWTYDYKLHVREPNLAYRVHVDHQGDPLEEPFVDVDVSRAAPPGVKLSRIWTPSRDGRPAYEISNNLDQPIFSHHEGGNFLGYVLKQTAEEWAPVRLGPWKEYLVSGHPIAPGEKGAASEHELAPSLPRRTLQSGHYRFTVSYSLERTLTVKRGLNESIDYVLTDDFEIAP